MKDIAKIIFFSALGGLLTLGGYKLYIEESYPKPILKTKNISPIFTSPVSNNLVNNNINTIGNVSLTTAAEKTINSVVHVTNTATYLQPRNIFDYYNNRGKEIEKGSTGSGVIITGDGYIVTNNHVIENADKLTVTLNNQKKYPAKVIGTDKKNDIALIKIETEEQLAYIPFGDSDNAKIGEWVLAVGNPYNLTSTVTAGIISAKSRDLDGDNNIQSFIQTDAAVNPGNSGGALVNTQGELIGINTAISSRTGSYVGYSFAVPSNITRKIVEDIMEFGNVKQGILGVNGVGLNNNVVKHYDLKETEGYYISSIQPNSGAEKAGLKSGDIIKKVDNIKISKSADLTGYLNAKRPGNIVNVTVARNGELKTIPVKLTDKSILTRKAFGLELKNLSDTDTNNSNVKSGLKVVKSNSDFLTKKLGISKGCIITQINEVAIENIDDLNKINNLSLENIYNIEVIYKNGKSKNWWLR